jgi:hypothetical protein
MTFEEMCKNIISEAKKTNKKDEKDEKKLVDGEKEKPSNIIVDDETDKTDKTEEDNASPKSDDKKSDEKSDDNENEEVVEEEETTEGDAEIEGEITTEDADEEEPAEKDEVQLLLDDVEREFLENYIEYSELTCLAKYSTEMYKGIKSVLGRNTKAIADYLNTRKEERKARLDELKTTLKSLRETIQNEEKAKAAQAERKLHLVSLLDKAKATEDTK